MKLTAQISLKMNLLELPVELFIEILLTIFNNGQNLAQLGNVCKCIVHKDFQQLLKSSRFWRPLLLTKYNTFKPQIFALEKENTSKNFHLNLYKQFHRNILFNSTEFRDLYSIVLGCAHNRIEGIQFVEMYSNLTLIPVRSVYRSTKKQRTTPQSFELEVKLSNWHAQINRLSNSCYDYKVGNSETVTYVSRNNTSPSNSNKYLLLPGKSVGPILKNVINTKPIQETITFNFTISDHQVIFDKRPVTQEVVEDDDEDGGACMCGGCCFD